MSRTKGVALIQMVKFLRSHRAHALEVLPGDLLHYLDERVLAGSWYPEHDILRILQAVVQLLGNPKGFEFCGAMLARSNLASIYGHVLRPGHDIRSVLSYISGLWSNYHDTGAESATFDEDHCRIELRGFDVHSAEYCRVIGAYNAELIELTGAKLRATRKLSCTARGDEFCTWEYEWWPAAPPPG